MTALFDRTMGESAITREPILSRIITKTRQAFIPFEGLKDDVLRGVQRSATFARAVDRLRIMRGTPRNMREVAASALEHVFGPKKNFGARDYELFKDKVWADELLETATRRGDSYSFPGIKRTEAIAEAKAEVKRLQPLLDANPRARVAYERHLEVSREMGRELAVRGLISPEEGLRQFYMHHRIMDHIREAYNAKDIGVRFPALSKWLQGQKKTAPPGVREFRPGQTKARSGGGVTDISRDFLTIQYEYLATTLEAIKRFDMLQEIGGIYHTEVKPGEAMPAGYVAYNLRRGLAGFEGRSAGEHLFNETLDGIGPTLAKTFGIDLQDAGMLLHQLAPKPFKAKPVREVKDIASVQEGGAPQPMKIRDEIVIPKELADAMSVVTAERVTVSQQLGIVRGLNRIFKSIVLHKLPIQYNVRNFVGDGQRAVAQFGKEIFDVELAKAAATDVWAAYRERNLSPRMQAAQELNVLNSGRTAVEVAKVRDVKEFQRLFESKEFTAKRGIQAVTSIFKQLPRIASAREDLLRVMIFYMNLNRMAKGQKMLNGTVDIKGLEAEPVRAAAKVARESLIDYGNFTVFENTLRETIMPFYAWMAGNAAFWPRAVKGAIKGTGSPAGTAGAVSAQGFAMIVGFTVAARVWNELIMGDAERALPEYIQKQNHIILPDVKKSIKAGRPIPWIRENDSGKMEIVSISVPDAADDFVELIGMNGFAPEIKHVLAGRMGLVEFLKRRGEDAIYKDGIPLPGTVNELLNIIGPLGQVPLALIGVRTFPEPLDAQEIPRYSRGGALLGAAGLSGLPFVGDMVDIPQVGSVGMLGPPAKSPFDFAEQAGLRSDVIRQPKEDYFVRGTRIRQVRLRTDINELAAEIKRLRAGVSLANMSPKERAQRVDKLERTRYTLVREFQRRASRLKDILDRATPINIRNN